MSSSDVVIKVSNLSKYYEIYSSPRDRLKQFIFPQIRRILRLPAKAYFNEFWALRDVSFELRKGETIGIVGRNGSGKSTLLQMICGTLSPTSGVVETRGRVAALLELGSGFNPEFTGRENVYMSASVLGLSNSEIDARFDKIINFAEIGDFIEQPVKTYSSGMYVRLAFAVIAHVDADVLVVDEALAVGDVFFTQKCMRFLRKFMETGTVLFVSHDTPSIVGLCTRALWIDSGQVVQAGFPKDVCEAYLEATYEAKQGKSARQISKTEFKSEAKNNVAVAEPDTNTVGDIHVSDFNPESRSFGKGGATISRVYLQDERGVVKKWIVGGEYVSLNIFAEAHMNIDSIIVGFFVKDRLGQMLFGDNTILETKDKSVSCKEGDTIQANFDFVMPWLPAGDYSITISIANGDQSNHEQQHWIHDAVVFKSNSERVCNGLVGIPILKSHMEVHALQKDVDDR